MISRIGIIGDVHTEADALEQALAWFREAGVDVTVCMGDLVDGHGDEFDVDRCCELLSNAEIATVCGNHDRWLLDDSFRDRQDATLGSDLDPDSLRFLRELPVTVELDTVAGRVLVCHGLGADDMGLLLPHDHGHEVDDNRSLQQLVAADRYPIVLNGHSHRRMARFVPPLWVINAGTLHRDNSPCIGVVDLDARKVDYVTVAGDPLESLPLHP